MKHNILILAFEDEHNILIKQTIQTVEQVKKRIEYEWQIHSGVFVPSDEELLQYTYEIVEATDEWDRQEIEFLSELELE